MNDRGMVYKNLKSLDIKTVVDVGGFYGEFSEKLNEEIDIDSTIFEANPYCEEFLKKQKFPYNIAALSDTEQVRHLYLRDEDDPDEDPWITCTGASFFLENTPAYKYWHTIPLQTKLLDSFDVYPEGIDLLKIDVQGAEVEVIGGAKETLKRTKYCLLECSLINYNHDAPRFSELIKKMNDNGFFIHSIVNEHVGSKNETIGDIPHGEKVLQLDILFSCDQTENKCMLDIMKYQEEIIF
jgi:FkbM family methyltransferase